MELTEKFLLSLGGWQAFSQARSLHAAGRISEATYEPPILKGRFSEGGRQFLAGLRLRNAIDIENLCPCRDSRVRGVICAHSLAVGLAVLRPAQKAAEPRQTIAAAAAAPTDETPAIELLIEGSLRHLEAEISFRYARPGVSNPGKEAEAVRRLIACGFEDSKGKAVLRGEDAIIRFSASSLPELRKDWNVREGERFRHVTRDFVRIEPHFALRERDDGWLDFHVHYTAGSEAVFSAGDLSRLLQAGRGHLRLGNGRVAVADPALAADLEEVLRDCNPRQEQGAYRIPALSRAYLEASVSRWSGGASVESPNPVPPPTLGSLAESLRPYQILGAQWMLARAREGSGGLLADEMGLGKTIQALAMVECLPGPVLVVCPSSLVWNWRREAGRFLPSLKVLCLDGADRIQRFAAIPEHRLIVTSYAILRRDIERYHNLVFDSVILDEAQHIKNPESQNARAACALAARSRFILTGTPIENSLRDLWSLFEFLLPGYLGSRNDFRERYEVPLQEGARGSVWERLNRRLSPWVVRRRKQEILAELPAKIEQVVEVELSDEQKSAYTQLQQAARAQIDALAGQQAAARMRVLTALLRLRQACCDLRLLGSETGHSAKLGALMELLEEAVDGGHRTLVFSQFTSMLDLIGAALDEAGLRHCRLDGSTRDREEVVRQFQDDSGIPVFLISLKAGGVGLNLTAADTVIHFDPWWNPAVEAQATDRAHRIGQSRVVTSIKLIARETVEERVLKMQEGKRELLAGALDSDSALARLSPGDLAELVG